MKFNFQPDPYKHRLTHERDIRLRYDNSVVLYKDQPVYIQANPQSSSSKGFDEVLVYNFLSTRSDFSKTWQKKNMIDPLFNTNFRLGWGRINSDLFYVERRSNRSYLQGMNNNNTRVLNLLNFYKEPDVLTLICLTHLGGFDTLKDIELNPDNRRSFIFSREVVLNSKGDNQFDVYVGVDKVGVYDLTKKEVEFKIGGFYSVCEQSLINAGLI